MESSLTPDADEFVKLGLTLQLKSEDNLTVGLIGIVCDGSSHGTPRLWHLSQHTTPHNTRTMM